jgi:hypothetical protein
MTVAMQPGLLESYGMMVSATEECFGGSHLRENVTTILNAVLPQVQTALGTGRFTLRDLLDLRQVSENWPRGGLCVYLRIYIKPLDQPDGAYSDSTQASIDQHVGLYIGSTNNAQRRDSQHTHTTDNPLAYNYQLRHYGVARKSAVEDRRMVPLMFFSADTPRFVVQMAEQTMIMVFGCYDPFLYTAVRQTESPGWVSLKQRAQYLNSIANAVRPAVGWPRLSPRGCNVNSPLFETTIARLEMNAIPMVSGDQSVRTFTTYRIRRNMTDRTYGGGQFPLILFGDDKNETKTVLFTLPREVLDIQGPNPRDSKGGFLVFEVMDDKKPHPRAWFGAPSVGTFENFDQASCFAVRYEWLDQSQQKWYTIPIARRQLGWSGMRNCVPMQQIEKMLEPWRTAMSVLQAIEGITYTAPLNGFPKQLRVAEVMTLETDHLHQRYRWIPRPRKTMPAPKLAIWDDNFALMYRRFNTALTYVGPTEPIPRTADVLNRKLHDTKGGSTYKCDTCAYMGRQIKCERDESRTDVWVCKCCSMLHRPCTFTAVSERRNLWGETLPHRRIDNVENVTGLAYYPNGPHRFMAFHITMHIDELCTVTRIPKPLLGHLQEIEREVEEDEDGNEDGHAAVDDDSS